MRPLAGQGEMKRRLAVLAALAFFRDELLTLMLSAMGEDRVLFAVDYPFVSNQLGADWFRALDLPRAAREKIAHRNAEKLLGIGPF